MSLIKEANNKGFRVWRNGDKLAFSPGSKATDIDKQWFRDNKQDFFIELAGGNSKVGTNLKRVIEKLVPKKLLDKVPEDSCDCENYEIKMNDWGIEECLKREEEIVRYLSIKANYFGRTFKLMPTVVKEKAARRLFHMAIKRERKRLNGL